MDLVASEIESLRALRHPHIVEYLGTEKEDNTLRIFLEYALSLSLICFSLLCQRPKQ
jgi:serine/threonine protein kinase